VRFPPKSVPVIRDTPIPVRERLIIRGAVAISVAVSIICVVAVTAGIVIRRIVSAAQKKVACGCHNPGSNGFSDRLQICLSNDINPRRDKRWR
jgi:hypothetical protein